MKKLKIIVMVFQNHKTEFFKDFKRTYYPDGISFYQKDLRVNIIDEFESDYVFMNAEGLKIKFPKNILQANQLPVIKKTVKLTESIYKNWFVKKREELLLDLSKIVEYNLHTIIDNKQIVLKNPNYFLIRLPWLFIGYGKQICLGAWLESMDNLEFEVTHKQTSKIERLIITFINGSPLSGIHSCSGWSILKKEIKRGYSSKRKHGIKSIFNRLSQQYPSKWKEDLKQTTTLLNELGIKLTEEMRCFVE